MSGKLILAGEWHVANHSLVRRACRQVAESPAKHLPQIDNNQSWLVAPQIHQYLTAYGESVRDTIGAEFDLQVKIAENLGPIPCEYIFLLLDVLDHCVGYFGWRENGSSSAQIRLSQLCHNRRFSHLLLEVGNRDSGRTFAQKLSEELLRLRVRIEFWSGFLRVDSVSSDETTIRMALPIVSINHPSAAYLKMR
jgi:hypothetical protein